MVRGDGQVHRRTSQRVRKAVTNSKNHKLIIEGPRGASFTLLADSDVSVAFVLSEAIREFGEEHLLTAIVTKDKTSPPLDLWMDLHECCATGDHLVAIKAREEEKRRQAEARKTSADLHALQEETRDSYAANAPAALSNGGSRGRQSDKSGDQVERRSGEKSNGTSGGGGGGKGGEGGFEGVGEEFLEERRRVLGRVLGS